MINLPNKTTILALHRENDIAIYQRFFDRSTSGWRYRCGGTYFPEEDSFKDYNALRKNNPNKVKEAVHRTVKLGAIGMSMANFGGPEGHDQDQEFLLFLADLQRFLSVNSLIVSKHFRRPAVKPVDFRRYTPIYNLIVALDLTSFAARALEHELPILLEACRKPGFKDDTYFNASGTFRALADMLARKGADASQLEVLEISQKLNSNPGKAVRIVRLMLEQDRKKEADKELQFALLKWPDSKQIKSLAKSRQE